LPLFHLFFFICFPSEKRRGLGFVDRGLPALTHKLIKCRHSVPPFGKDKIYPNGIKPFEPLLRLSIIRASARLPLFMPPHTAQHIVTAYNYISVGHKCQQLTLFFCVFGVSVSDNPSKARPFV
jgi:hypothetical protein